MSDSERLEAEEDLALKAAAMEAAASNAGGCGSVATAAAAAALPCAGGKCLLQDEEVRLLDDHRASRSSIYQTVNPFQQF